MPLYNNFSSFDNAASNSLFKHLKPSKHTGVGQNNWNSVIFTPIFHSNIAARMAGASISETVELFVFFKTTISRTMTEFKKRGNAISN